MHLSLHNLRPFTILWVPSKDKKPRYKYEPQRGAIDKPHKGTIGICFVRNSFGFDVRQIMLLYANMDFEFYNANDAEFKALQNGTTWTRQVPYFASNNTSEANHLCSSCPRRQILPEIMISFPDVMSSLFWCTRKFKAPGAMWFHMAHIGPVWACIGPIWTGPGTIATNAVPDVTLLFHRWWCYLVRFGIFFWCRLGFHWPHLAEYFTNHTRFVGATSFKPNLINQWKCSKRVRRWCAKNPPWWVHTSLPFTRNYVSLRCFSEIMFTFAFHAKNS